MSIVSLRVHPPCQDTKTDMRTLLLLLSMFVANPVGLHEAPPPKPSILLLNAEQKPHISISWETASGDLRVYQGDRAWGADADRTPIGANIAAYVAAGGLRLTNGAGHPKGAIIRFGFYKIDPDASFFADITASSIITVEMTGVHFNQPARPITRTAIQHLKFAREALVSCRVPSNAWSLYNTVDPTETLNGRARPDYDSRPGSLSGAKPTDGSVHTRLEDDGSITVRAEIPYALMKHIRDPWQQAIPGTFLEPIHFHVEIEVLPEGVPELPVDPTDPRD